MAVSSKSQTVTEPSIRRLRLSKDGEEWGSKGNEADYLSKLRRLLAKMEPDDQKTLAVHGPKGCEALGPGPASRLSKFSRIPPRA
jgi:hypothetical protein